MPSMTKEEMEKFLAGPNIAKVATVKKDGAPFVVPVWYDWDGKYCYLVGRKKAGWVKHIAKDARVTVLIDEQEPPYAKVVIEGKAKIVGDTLEDWIEIGKRMVKKYYGPEAGESYLEGSIDQPRKTIRVKPKTIVSWVTPKPDDLAKKPRLSWPSKYYVPGTKWYKDYKREKKVSKKEKA